MIVLANSMPIGTKFWPSSYRRPIKFIPSPHSMSIRSLLDSSRVSKQSLWNPFETLVDFWWLRLDSFLERGSSTSIPLLLKSNWFLVDVHQTLQGPIDSLRIVVDFLFCSRWKHVELWCHLKVVPNLFQSHSPLPINHVRNEALASAIAWVARKLLSSSYQAPSEFLSRSLNSRRIPYESLKKCTDFLMTSSRFAIQFFKDLYGHRIELSWICYTRWYQNSIWFRTKS